MDHSLIEAVLKHHSKSHAAINSLHDQLHSLEVLRDSAKKNFVTLQESGVDLDQSANSLIHSSSRLLIPSPVNSPKLSLDKHTGNSLISDLISTIGNSEVSPRGTEVDEQNTYCQRCANENNSSNITTSSPSKMRLSESQMSGFDISAILAQMSPPRPFNTSTLTPPNQSSGNDELLTILEKISLTGHQLQVELENAKMRETLLVDKIKSMQSNSNGFHKISPAEKSDSPSKFVTGESPKQGNKSDQRVSDLNSHCEKLQEAMLSLQDENIKLNRILRDQSMSTNGERMSSLTDAASEKCIVELQERLMEREKEIVQLKQKIEQLKESVDVSENDLRRERDKAAMMIKQTMKVAELNPVGGDCGLGIQSRSQYNEQQLLKLSAELQTKLDKSQLENKNCMMKNDSLKKKLEVFENLKKNEEMSNFRIEELHAMLVTKDKEIEHLQVKINGLSEQLAEKDRATRKIKHSDITKRKEVLLLCEKYEQLKKNKKRLESDLYESQQKVQEAITRSWVLESSVMKASEENKILKHQLEIHENLVSASTEAHSNDQHYVAKILKDYEKLTEKYEALLDLRINEYGRIKISKRDKKSMGDMEDAKLTSKYKQFEKEDGDIMSESMRKREEDFYNYYAHDLSELIPSNPVHSIRKMHLNFSHGESQARLRPKQLIGKFHDSLQTKENIDTAGVPCSSAVAISKSASNRYETGSDVKTSTPVKTYDGHKLHQSKSIFDEKNCNPKYDFSAQANKLSMRSDSLRSRTIESSQPRSKSLSPIRPPLLQESEGCNYEPLPCSSRDSQKSVSFLLSPLHRRSKSTSSVIDRKKLSTPTLKGKTSVGRRTSISPVDVLEKVKSAYQEEYLQNMVGVNFILSPGNSPPNQKKTTGEVRKLNDAAELKSLRYKKKSENIRNLVNKSYGNGDSYTICETSSSTNSSSPKSILKKPRNEFQHKKSLVGDNAFDDSTSTHEDALMVVREKENNSWDVSILPPERFQDTEKDSKQRLNYTEDSIIEVEARTAQQNDSFSLSSSDNAKSSFTPLPNTSEETTVPSNANRESSNHTAMALHGMIKDLTIPIQLAGAMKDDDVDSIGHSSVSSTNDHIGRFEFLQEMQTALKSPAFSYQKKAEYADRWILSPKIVKEKSNAELGLSARQQEYADKLIRKYTKKFTCNK